VRINTDGQKEMIVPQIDVCMSLSENKCNNKYPSTLKMSR